MTVSAVLPCYNAAGLILQAIDSIRRQTFEDWELIVVDDASSDGSGDVVESVQDTRVRLIRLADNGGYPRAMNVGIAAARGQYIARIDADDVCDAIRFERQLEALRLFPRAALCGLNRYLITPGGKAIVARAGDEDHVIETWDDIMSNKRIFTDPSVILRKSLVDGVGGYRTFQRSGDGRRPLAPGDGAVRAVHHAHRTALRKAARPRLPGVQPSDEPHQSSPAPWRGNGGRGGWTTSRWARRST